MIMLALKRGKMMGMLKRAQRIFLLTLLVLLVCRIGGCKREKEAPLMKPEAPKEYYVITDSFETIYTAMTNPNHTEIDRYNIWAAYRGKKIKWAAEFVSAKVDRKNVQATLSILYDKKQKKLIAGVEALFEGKSGEDFLREITPGKKIVFEGVLTNYHYTQDGAFIISVSSARLAD